MDARLEHGQEDQARQQRVEGDAASEERPPGPCFAAGDARVGEGPFPSEQDNEIGRFLGERGHEFGTVTGRKRRCGWFDAVLVRQTCTTSGVTGIALQRSSGDPRLDEAALAMVARASPLPPIPSEVGRASVSMVLPVRFTR